MVGFTDRTRTGNQFTTFYRTPEVMANNEIDACLVASQFIASLIDPIDGMVVSTEVMT